MKSTARNACSRTIKALRRSAAAALLGALAFTAGAQTSVLRPVTSSYTVEYGTAHLADTYLTPLHYDGTHSGIAYSRWQAMKFSPQAWVMKLDLAGFLDRTRNPARNATMWNLELEARWAMMRRWQPIAALPRLTLGIGPSTQLRGGAFFLARNGNNPASAKGAWTVGASGYASWSFAIGRLPVTARYEAVLPVTGAFFAPQYGELYYEIWMGNRSGLAHAAWWGNYFAMDNRASLLLRFGATTLSLGYHNQILSTKVSDVVTRGVTHSFSVGIVTEWLSLPVRRQPDKNVQIISATY